MLVIAGGAFLLPACFRDKGKAYLPFEHLRVTGDQGETMRQLSAAILPKTTTAPGADELHAHLFALKMADDCLSTNNQERLQRGMTAFDKFCQTNSGSAFTTLTEEKKKDLLSRLDENKNPSEEPDDLAFFYQNMKHWTVQAYTTSQYYLTTIRNYNIIPGRFVGSVPVPAS